MGTETGTGLNARSLKQALWETIKDLKSGAMQPAVADAIAAQSREILRAGRLQLHVAKQSGRNLPEDLLTFSESSESGDTPP